jgi:hypothetical protein
MNTERRSRERNSKLLGNSKEVNNSNVRIIRKKATNNKSQFLKKVQQQSNEQASEITKRCTTKHTNENGTLISQNQWLLEQSMLQSMQQSIAISELKQQEEVDAPKINFEIQHSLSNIWTDEPAPISINIKTKAAEESKYSSNKFEEVCSPALE